METKMGMEMERTNDRESKARLSLIEPGPLFKVSPQRMQFE